MHINGIIAGLLEPQKALPPFQRQEFVIRLAMWLRFPSEPAMQSVACLAGYINYVNSHHRNKAIVDLPSAEAALLQRNLNMEHLSALLAGRQYSLPSFEYFDEKRPGSHVYQYMADIVRFLIWYKPDTIDKRKQASLHKAYFFLKDRGFDHQTDWSRRWLIRQWKAYKSASPILYVNYYHADQDLLLNPETKDFRSRVDALTNDPKLIHSVLGKAKWVADRLSDRLDRKAINTLGLPTFPGNFEGIAIPDEYLGDDVMRVLQRYDIGFDENTMGEDYDD